MQQKTAGILAVLSILIVCGLVGCGGQERIRPVEAPKPFAGQTVRVACPDTRTRTIAEQESLGWQQRTGAVVELVDYDAAADDGLARAGADLWVMRPAVLPDQVTRDQLTQLPEVLTSEKGALDIPGFLSLYREYLMTWQGKHHYAAPLTGEAMLCFYNKELLADVGQKEGPRTWEEYVEIAEKINQKRGEKGPPPLPALPSDVAELERLYYSIAAPFVRQMLSKDEDKGSADDKYSFHFDHRKGTSRIASPGFAHALQLLQRSQKLRPTRKVAEPWQAFRDGQAALCVGDPWLLSHFQKPGSPVRDKVGVCPVPGSRGYYSYEDGKWVQTENNWLPYLGARAWLLAVPRSAKHAEAAFDLLGQLCGKAT